MQIIRKYYDYEGLQGGGNLRETDNWERVIMGGKEYLETIIPKSSYNIDIRNNRLCYDTVEGYPVSLLIPEGNWNIVGRLTNKQNPETVYILLFTQDTIIQQLNL
jgi:hypothetical protein